MPLDRDQVRALEEIVSRSRRTYREALRMLTHQQLNDDKLAEMVVDTKLASSYTEILWRQTGEIARERHARLAPHASEPAPELSEGEDDPPA